MPRLPLLALVLVPFLVPSFPAGEKAKVLDIGPKGATVNGEIKKDDPKFKFDHMDKTFDMPSKVFTIKPNPAIRYRITMDTDDPKLDCFLLLKDKKGDIIAFDDDSGGGLNSLLSLSFPAEGAPYELYASSLHGTPGAFHLQILPQATVFREPKVYEVGKKPLRIEGQLTAERQEIVYQVKLQAGKSYRIDLTSKKIDSYLELRDASGKLLAEDDDKGGKLDSRIVTRPAKDGIVHVIAGSTNFAQTGPFTLELRQEK
ncbi:MAG: PPC domain-containing protein [Gemmataceae bacterium]